METENNNSNGLSQEMQHIIDDQLEAIETAKGKFNKQNAKNKIEEEVDRKKHSLLWRIKNFFGFRD